MADETREVVLVHRGLGVVVLDDDTMLPVTNWIDEDGEELEPAEADLAVACVAGEGAGPWFAVDLERFGYEDTH